MTSPIPITLAVEDELSEFVLRRLLAESPRDYYLGIVYRRGGYGYLKKTLPGWNSAAASRPFLVLTDLDDATCPSALVSSWLNSGPQHPNFMVRVAVREVEAWLLADATGFANFTGVKQNLLPVEPERLIDPKQQLIHVVQRSRNRRLKAQIVPKPKSTARVGREYNSALSDFVNTDWDPQRAAERAPSLARAISRINSFEAVY